MSKWKNEAGPNQARAVNKAMSRFESKAMQTIEVEDWGEMIVCKMSLCGEQKYAPGFVEKCQQIGEKYDWTITRKNANTVRKEFEEATEALQLPRIDCRTKEKAK